jgi:very-short-patch-repair endonuclease
MAERWREVLEERLREQATSEASWKAWCAAKDIDELCQSPIEKLFAASLGQLEDWEMRGFTISKTQGDVQRTLLENMTSDRDNIEWVGIATPQYVYGRYKLDFLLTAIFRFPDETDVHFLSLAVECDGHDFHERTKEQAANDRARDRELLAAGIPVFRFTGSQIFRTPEKCVDEVERYFNNWSTRIRGRELPGG